ncbi:alanine dehydrogenase [Paenibacillus dakarensis]|uniref:alanine dehydrogenase n=1 Tax=Paenibacillus dakarensis TaxID=1527293 RepID=UPI0006D5A57D|nr:alanine dehydrogenase [Paenibacillus dakarensis]
MIIGLVTEIKNNEHRVGLTPGGVGELVRHGHQVLVEKNAGMGSGFEDRQYSEAGATVLADKKALFDQADLIVKVKEPLESEYDYFCPGQALYTYLHLSPNLSLTRMLLEKRITGIAYETVQLNNGQLPLLAPMSEIAGRMSVQIGASLLQKYNGGMGILLGGVPGVANGEVVIIGGGVVGTNAAKMAIGLGARVTVLDVSKSRLVYLDDIFSGRIRTLICNEYNVTEAVRQADLLIGAVLIPGANAPKIVRESVVRTMKKGSVIVDVAIDQGGSIETIDRITTHDQPSYEKHGVVHYSVANIPGAVPRTSTFALESATLPYLVQIANKGVRKALLEDASLLKGLNTYAGKITCQPVAVSHGLEYTDSESLLQAEH